MKEKIERLASGNIEYELPALQLSCEEIIIRVEAGKRYEGSFTISNSAKRVMNGSLYSSGRLLTLNQESFCGSEIFVTYRFDASYLKPCDVVEGNIVIVSDCGEVTLPFTAYIEAPAIDTSAGKINNLSDFAELAKMDWTEAKKVFRCEEFEPVILKNEEKYRIIHQNLLRSISTSQALEEFLIAVNQKSRINLCVDKTELKYDVYNEDILDKLVLTKDHWGYAEIRVSTDAPFIQLQQKFLWTDRFIGNEYQISFNICSDKLRPGSNYGKILIKTVYQTITVEVFCQSHKERSTVHKKPNRSLRFGYNFAKNYLDFRTGRINREGYLKETDILLSELDEQKDSTLIKLIKIYAAILSNDKKTAAFLLEDLSEEEDDMKERSAVEYCAYLYLLALYWKDDKTIKYVADTIGRYYLSENYDWRILWFLFYTDRRYESNRYNKIEYIKEQYKSGCRSPILYYEALCVYNDEPYLLRELTDFEIQVVNYGIKNDCLARETALQYTYLAGRLKYYNPIVYRGLVRLYEKYENEEILSAICSLLIKGFKRERKYFDWYKKGVCANLRITQLYEYFMYSVDEDSMEPLPQSLLIYFAYNNRLNDRQRAYLYANIIKNNKDDNYIYQLYYKNIEAFVREQLEAKNISPNLAIIYKEFINKPELAAYFAKYLPDIMFTDEIYCSNPNIVSTIVVHKELEEAQTVNLTEGRACIQIYTPDAFIFLTDSFGNRYAVSVDYTVKPLLRPEDCNVADLDYENNSGLLLYIYDYCRKNQIINDEVINLIKHVLMIPGLKEPYYTDCLLNLIEYYYNNYNEDYLEYYLMKLDLSKVEEHKRVKYLEHMIERGYYGRVLEALNIFGADGISVQSLVKLCSGWITCLEPEGRGEKIILYLCHELFATGKYDKTILNYLVKYYRGSTEDMLKLWEAADNAGIDTLNLEKRILMQILYTESDNEDKFRLFLKYYQTAGNHLMVRAFLTYYAYRYLVHDQQVSSEIFAIMRRELNYEENSITLLAWLKYNASSKELEDDDKKFISYNIDRMARQGIILPFFKKYENAIKLPERIYDKYYVEYKADPKKHVFIHYRIIKNASDSKEFITERMSDVFLGIHVKEFTLFYNEKLEYYVTEESEEEVNTTEHREICYDDKNDLKEDTKYRRINNMLKALDKGDKEALLDQMEEYVTSEYIINKCYEPLP